MPTSNAKRKLLRERLQYFKDEVDPKDIVPLLNCLIEEDRQEVECERTNHGAIKALDCLVDRVRRRDKGFEQFVVALRSLSLDHVALLLDPYESVEPNDAGVPSVNDDEKFQIIGTAVDVEVNMRIKFEKERKIEFEETITKTYQSSTSEQTCKLRKELKKLEMPHGIEFVRTKPNSSQTNNQKDKNEQESEAQDDETDWNDSIKVYFRLTSAGVVRDFWKMYESLELENKLRHVLVGSTLLSLKMLDNEDALQIDLKMFEEEYHKILNFFEEKESEQEMERTAGDLLRRGPENGVPEALDEIDIKIPEVLLESHRSNVQKRDLKLREYQKELSSPAIEGKNTIICAPTNSGKTFVAMEIARLHLEKYSKKDGAGCACAVGGNDLDTAANSISTGQPPKIVFIVSTQNLVLQQRQRFEEYLTKYSISDISGSNSTEIPLDFLIKTHDVIILTAQILMNAIKRRSVNISQITLLIFDECHHTNKDHTYNKIMQNYMALKWQGDDIELPQIVGLTASLGVGKSNETEKAKNHILQICANMDAYCISTVRKNIEELERNVTGGVPTRKLEKVDQQPNVFEKVIFQVMEKIEKAVQNLSSPSSPHAPADRVGQQYRQWVEGVEKDGVSKSLRDLSTYAKQLRSYHIALLINDTVRVQDAMKYLEEYFANRDRTKFQPSDTKLQELYEKAIKGIQSRVQNAAPNPKLEKLKELILKFHKEDDNKGKSGETKGILFTRTRDSTKGLIRWIHETEELKSLLRPKVLVGAGDGEVGMTQGEQEAIIEEFKKGEVNILIATTVAEEGLDIGDCNFVIRYGMAGNEISSVQARGRIRADDGNYVYVGDSRTKGVDRERLNQYREILMTIAVAEVQQLPHDCYLKEIKEIQKKDVQKSQLKNFLNSRKVNAKQVVGGVIFFCRGCNKKACDLNEFRRLKENYHVILEKDFKHRIHVKPKKKAKKIDDVLMASQVHCKVCDEDWGVTVKIDGLTWPCLKIRSFAVQFPEGKRIMYKKWSDFKYEIPEATTDEIIKVDDTLDNDDLDFD